MKQLNDPAGESAAAGRGMPVVIIGAVPGGLTAAYELSIEYFCFEGDDLWKSTDEAGRR